MRSTLPLPRTRFVARRARAAIAATVAASVLVGAGVRLTGGEAAGGSHGSATGPAPCDPPEGAALRPSRDLYCLELTPVPGLDGVTALLELGREPSPFTVNVTVDGSQRYAPTLILDGLPAPGALGDYQGFVAWVTTPVLHPEMRLGVVGNGRSALPDISLDKFLVLVTAEEDTSSAERRGKLLLRGGSPSTRMQPADVMEFVLGSVGPTGSTATPAADSNTAAGAARAEGAHAAHAPPAVSLEHGGSPAHGLRWTPPPMPPGLTMLPALMRLSPRVRPWLPDTPVPPGAVPLVRPRELLVAEDGDTIDLTADFVRRTLGGKDVVMYGFNGQHPGPLLEVPADATVVVRFTNRIDQPTTVHWHGVRLDNRFDGVPGVTQEPVAPGETFVYRVHFPDAGIYWYHPHVREDQQQDLGLYGNLLVRSSDPDWYGPVHREEVLMLDDLLVGDDGMVPFGLESATHTLMGRFGNVLLVNGEPGWRAEASRGEVVRFFLTNVSNTRTFNVSFGGAPMKVVGSDVGKYEREAWVESVPIAPAERYVVHVRFERGGSYALENRVRAIDHLFGAFFPEVDTLGTVTVRDEAVAPALQAEFERLRPDDGAASEIARYREHFDRPVDRELVLAIETRGLPFVVERLMIFDSTYFHPVEWSGTMPEMNWAATGEEVRWVLREPSTGLENMDIRWSFRAGELVKVRLSNERRSFHAMQHPLHVHGQRFLVLEENGVRNDNLVWKDTVLLPVGTTVDLLLELSNPGKWMAHCHIAEHMEAGMMTVFTVEGG